MIELERTFLAKRLPNNLDKFDKKEIADIYLPENKNHPTLRIRKSGDSFEITKKIKLSEDASEQKEFTIALTEEEFLALKNVSSKKVEKIRYYYPYEGRMAEIDIFLEDLYGLVLIDFEFQSVIEKNSFKMPDFCLVDITPEEFIAGGKLAGKKYSDIEDDLNKFNYVKLGR